MLIVAAVCSCALYCRPFPWFKIQAYSFNIHACTYSVWDRVHRVYKGVCRYIYSTHTYYICVYWCICGIYFVKCMWLYVFVIGIHTYLHTVLSLTMYESDSAWCLNTPLGCAYGLSLCTRTRTSMCVSSWIARIKDFTCICHVKIGFKWQVVNRWWRQRKPGSGEARIVKTHMILPLIEPQVETGNELLMNLFQLFGGSSDGMHCQGNHEIFI